VPVDKNIKLSDLESPDENVRLNAIAAVAGRLDAAYIDPLLNACASESWPVRFRGLEALSAYPAKQLLPALEKALRNDENAALRSGAITMIEGMGDGARPLLEKLLRDADSDVRIFSASLMGPSRIREYVRPLISALKDEEINVMHAAAESLGKIGDPRAVEPLLDLLGLETWLLFPIIQALGKLKDARAVPGIMPLLEDELLSELVIEALRLIGDPLAVPHLSKLISEEDEQIAEEAIAAIIDIEGNQARLPGEVAAALPALPIIEDILQTEIARRILLNMLQSQQANKVEAAIIAVMRLKDAGAVERLLGLAALGEFALQAIAAIVEIGSDAAAVLYRAAEDKNPRLRGVVARCLSNIKEPQALDTLLALAGDIAAEVRAEAVLALVRFSDEQVVQKLIFLLADNDLEVRAAVAEALAFMPGTEQQLTALLDSHNELLVAEAIGILGSKGDTAIRARLSELNDGAGPRVRAAIVRALGEIALPEDLPILIEALKDQDEQVATEAITALGKTGDPAVVKHLRKILKQKSVDSVRKYFTLQALGNLRIPDVLPEIIPYLKSNDTGLVYAAIETLGRLRNVEAADAIASVLKRPERDLRRAAVTALGMIEGQKAAARIIDAIDDNDWSVRNEAVNVLARIGGRRESHKLRRLLSDHNRTVRVSTILALGEIGSATSIQPLLSCLIDQRLQAQVTTALVQIGRKGLDELHHALQNPLPRARVVAASVLGEIGSIESGPFLIDAISDPVASVRAAAASSLGMLRDLSARPVLNRLAREDEDLIVAQQARQALLMMSGE
jgi:HEAT repeat protein